jgi:hypothetical protein
VILATERELIQYSDWWWLNDLVLFLDKGKNFSCHQTRAGFGVQSTFIQWVLGYLSLG